MSLRTLLPLLLLSVFPGVALGSEAEHHALAQTGDWRAILCVVIFVVSYIVVMTEEFHYLNKSKPVILAAGCIWLVIGSAAKDYGISEELLHEEVVYILSEFASLFLFLLVSMTYINTLNERNVFGFIRTSLVRLGLGYRTLFWVTGGITFFFSAIADNLVSALLMGTVIMAVDKQNLRFVQVSCVNIVLSANCGGAFSPFGDITTLMVWQAGKMEFFEFFRLFLPSLATYLLPAIIMTFAVPKGRPETTDERTEMKRGSMCIGFLFLCTIALAVTFEQVFHLPPYLGMMTGLSLLMIFTYYVRMSSIKPMDQRLDIYGEVSRAQWDTLLFFFGITFAVGGLSFLGYMAQASSAMYGELGASKANIIIGALSAIVDNIPVMFAILQMEPEMDHFQWLLVTLTVGVGGSLLSIGSAAGVGLMGVAREKYTFFSHLKWSPVIALGYAAGIGVHFLLRGVL